MAPPAAGRRDPDWDATLAEWFAGLFLAPLPAVMVESYRNGLGALWLQALEQEPACAQATRMMRAALWSDGSVEVAAHAIALSFSHLFEGLGGSRSVLPFESAHTGTANRLYQAPAGAMDVRLRQAGLAVATSIREPADHLSIELALLARLIHQRQGGATIAAMLDEQLCPWVARFANKVAGADRTGFYAGAASVLTRFLATQRASLARPELDFQWPTQ